MSRGLILLPQNLLQTNCSSELGKKNLWRFCWIKGTIQLLSQPAFPADMFICLRHPVVYKIPLVSHWLFTVLSKYAWRLFYTLKRCLRITTQDSPPEIRIHKKPPPLLMGSVVAYRRRELAHCLVEWQVGLQTCTDFFLLLLSLLQFTWCFFSHC